MPPVPDLQAAFADHDRLFKELLTVFFLDFVGLFLPDLAARIDAESVEFLHQELFSDMNEGSLRIVDLLVRVRLRDPANTEAFILIHVENQSKVEARFARRMFLITARLDEKYDLPIYPIALFSFNAPRRQESNRYEISAAGRTVLNFEFEAIQLNRLNWRDFVDRRNPVAVALMSRMRIAPADRPRVKLQCLRILATLTLDPARKQLISGFIDTYLRLNREESQVFDSALAALPPEEREAAMPLTISWKEEGRTEGRVEEARRVLLRIGEKRLGPPSTTTSDQIGAISSIPRLERMLDRLVEVDKWDELLAA